MRPDLGTLTINEANGGYVGSCNGKGYSSPHPHVILAWWLRGCPDDFAAPNVAAALGDPSLTAEEWAVVRRALSQQYGRQHAEMTETKAILDRIR